MRAAPHLCFYHIVEGNKGTQHLCFYHIVEGHEGCTTFGFNNIVEGNEGCTACASFFFLRSRRSALSHSSVPLEPGLRLQCCEGLI